MVPYDVLVIHVLTVWCSKLLIKLMTENMNIQKEIELCLTKMSNIIDRKSHIIVSMEHENQVNGLVPM